jgi:hypothetical protein
MGRTMRRMFLFILALCLCSGVFALDVEVEQVLDAPPSKFGTFYDDSATYASNGELLFESTLAFNLFVLREWQWVPLINNYNTEAYNDIQEHRGQYNKLYDSIIPGELLYFMVEDPHPQENYRIFVNGKGELQAEWVSQEYYDSHRLRYLTGGWNVKDGPVLQDRYRVNFRDVTQTPNGHSYSPEIVDSQGRVIYRFTDGFREGFVEDIWTITSNYDLDRVAMVISFRPEKDSPYYVSSRPRLKKLVVFKITYDSDCGIVGK